MGGLFEGGGSKGMLPPPSQIIAGGGAGCPPISSYAHVITKKAISSPRKIVVSEYM